MRSTPLGAARWRGRAAQQGQGCLGGSGWSRFAVPRRARVTRDASTHKEPPRRFLALGFDRTVLSAPEDGRWIAVELVEQREHVARGRDEVVFVPALVAIAPVQRPVPALDGV